MNRKYIFAVFFLLLFTLTGLAQEIKGTIIDKTSRLPLVGASIQLLNASDSSVVVKVLTDSKGKFTIVNISVVNSMLNCSFIGYRKKYLSLNTVKQNIDLGKIEMNSDVSTLAEVVITSNSNLTDIEIDRKVYDVSHDIMAQSGSASDILRNIPSVNVNINGRVSLRGTESVTILINGKPSPLMRKSLRAEALQQIAANSIERIEVITNPSAAFRSNGTGGIINIILKKNALNGWNGMAGINVSNKERYNGNINFNYKMGKLNVFSSIRVKQDNRYRSGNLDREYFDSSGTASRFYKRNFISQSKPISYIANLGAAYELNQHNDIGISGNFYYRKTVLHEDLEKNFFDSNHYSTTLYDRFLFAPQDQHEIDGTFYWQHNFNKKDNKLRIEINASSQDKQDNNHYSNIFQLPVNTITRDNILQHEKNNQQEVSADYSISLSEKSKFEAGYSGSFTQNDLNLLGENYDFGTKKYVKDLLKSNQFLYNENIHALYGTYQHKYSKFGYTVGVRVMQSLIKGDLVTRDSLISNNYFKIFPSLHLVYKLKKGQLQLNYSKRINLPESTDLNPFPDYWDPRNLQVGNPKLLPEIIHSMELGYKWQNKKYSFVPSLYYRYKENGFTNVLIPLNDSTTLRTQVNLSNTNSAGLELIFSAKPVKFFTFNLSSNLFYNTINNKDTSLGYRNSRSIFTMSTNLNCAFTFTKTLSLQINCNYNSAKLTAQGKMFANFVVNAGLRQYLFKNKMSVILTASDLLKTLNQKIELNSPQLHQVSIIKRDSQIFYTGISYRFGKIKNKSTAEEKLRYDNDL
ncbi:MAG: TonB-dependent receptor domain-containing protein [Ferruginibacter sp.]